MKYLTLMILASAFSAHASYYVECGNKMLADGSGFQTVKFKASSTDDQFSGRNGDKWSVALTGDWLPKDHATAKVINKNGQKAISIVISNGTGFSEIGKRFEITPMYDDAPALDIYAIGGFAGGTKLETVKCMTAND